MSSTKFIVFGPSGAVASSAALTARRLGADVVLAMRDTSKAVPGLTPEAEKQGGYQRVHADLSDPSSIAAAVRATSAKRAFIYLVHGNQDGMRAAAEALKSAGVEFVVFLSSVYVNLDGGETDLTAAVASKHYLTKVHAGVELSLSQVFGHGGYVALRPGFFASNIHRWASGLRASKKYTLEFPDRRWDWIVPADIGRVAAHVAVQFGPSIVDSELAGKEYITLLGPRLRSMREGTAVIAKAAGVEGEIEVDTIMDQDAALKRLVDAGIPPFLASELVEGRDDIITEETVKAGSGNIRKFGGGKVTELEEWAEANKNVI